jgi:alkylation response protein AidB-like acyl-CoA dehydrogenase
MTDTVSARPRHATHVDMSLHGFTAEELQVGQLAYEISAKYADRSLHDPDAVSSAWREMTAAGLTALGIPTEFGGAGENLMLLTLVSERTAAAGFPSSRMTLCQGIIGRILYRSGTDAQRQEWLPRLAQGDILFSFALTEAGSGSNAARMQTTARRTPGGWVVNGEKAYISDFGNADALLLAAQTPEAGGISMFLVRNPRERVEGRPQKMDITTSSGQPYTLFIDDLELTDDDVIGQSGAGLRAVFPGLNAERILASAQVIGLGRWGLDRAIAYANERVVFDVPIGSHQAVQHPLAEAYIQLECAWALNIAVARAYDDQAGGGAQANAAKVAAADAGFFALDRALQVHGGSGFTADVGLVERYMMARFFKTAPVTREMALNHLSVQALGLPRSY